MKKIKSDTLELIKMLPNIFAAVNITSYLHKFEFRAKNPITVDTPFISFNQYNPKDFAVKIYCVVLDLCTNKNSWFVIDYIGGDSDNCNFNFSFLELDTKEEFGEVMAGQYLDGGKWTSLVKEEALFKKSMLCIRDMIYINDNRLVDFPCGEIGEFEDRTKIILFEKDCMYGFILCGGVVNGYKIGEGFTKKKKALKSAIHHKNKYLD